MDPDIIHRILSIFSFRGNSMKMILKIGIKCVLLGIVVLLIHSQLTLVFRSEKFNQGNNFRGFGEDVFDVIV